MEPELQNKLDEMNKNLVAIKSGVKTPLWRSFLTGTMTGLGSVVGVAIALTIATYILNAIGVIPAFKSQVHYWQSALESLQQKR